MAAGNRPLCAQNRIATQSQQSTDQRFSQSVEQLLDSDEFRHIKRLKEAGKSSKVEVDEDEPSSPPELPFGNVPSAAASLFGNILTVFVWVGISAVVVLMIFLAVKALANTEWKKQSNDKRPFEIEEGDDGIHMAPGELTADEYRARAMKLAGQQEYREAISQLLLGAMSWAERNELIRFRRGLTHRDYLRAVGQQPAQQSAFHTLITTYEPLGFGRRTASQSIFEKTLTEYENSFGNAAAVSQS